MEKVIKTKYLICVLFLFQSYQLHSQTGGIYFTKEEVEIWKKRSISGPYKKTGDVSENSPGDWDRIMSEANSLVSNPKGDYYAGPTLDQNMNPITGQVTKGAGPEPGNKGMKTLNCAFVYLINRDPRYLEAAKASLLYQISNPMLNFADKSRWGLHLNDINPAFGIAELVTRLLIAYDYLQISDPKLDAWFLNATLYFQKTLDTDLNNLYSDREKSIIANYDHQKQYHKITHINGFQIPTMALHYNNRRGAYARLCAVSAVKYNNSSLKRSASLFFKETLKFATFPDGTVGEFERASSSNPDQGYAYAHSLVDQLIGIADVFARAGDISLYDYKTSEGIVSTTGGTKNLRLIIDNLCKYIDGTFKRYAINTTDPDCKIDGRVDKINWYSIYDVYFSQANVYYKDSHIKNVYTRKVSGMKQYPSRQASAGPTPAWNGSGGMFPGKLFMYGQMENAVNPYGGALPVLPVNAVPLVSAGSDKTITLPTSTVAINGSSSDSDGSIASYAWTQVSGTAATLSGATTINLSVSNLVAGTHSFRLTVKDNKGASAYDDVVVVVNAAATTTTPIPTPTPTPTTSFYRAINVNGPAATIDGNQWESGISNATFSFAGRPFALQTATLSPATDASRGTMIKSSVWRNSGTDFVDATVKNVPAGSYDVYMYTWEDNYSTDFELFLENTSVGKYSSGAARSWKKLSLGRVSITDGNIYIKAVGGDAIISGIEIHKVNAVTAPAPSPTPTPTASFYRAIDVNGPAATIDGNKWESGISNATFSFTGRPFALQTATLSPATDAARATMIKSCVWRNSGSDFVDATVKSVPAGTYEVYMYTWEDNASTNFEVFLENKSVGKYSSGAANSWKKLSLGTVNITDGNIYIKAVGGDAILSGIEIHKVTSTVAARAVSEVSSLEAEYPAYPNPFLSDLTVNLTPEEMDAENIKLTIMDYSGVDLKTITIEAGNQSSVSIDGLGGLKTGNYILQIRTDLSQRTIRVIKQ